MLTASKLRMHRDVDVFGSEHEKVVTFIIAVPHNMLCLLPTDDAAFQTSIIDEIHSDLEQCRQDRNRILQRGLFIVQRKMSSESVSNFYRTHGPTIPAVRCRGHEHVRCSQWSASGS